MAKDPYSKLDEKVSEWFMAILQGMVRNSQTAKFYRIKAGLDLEIVIAVAPEDRVVFTSEVCLALTELLRVTTQVAPVVYLEGDPHPQARQALDYAIRSV